MSKFKYYLLSLIILVACLAACKPSNQSPAQIVQNYLEALVNKDSAKLISYSCKNWENIAQTELDSIMNVKASLENVNCQLKSESSSYATVVCNGEIQLTYGTEVQKIELNKRTYHLTYENNEWRVCDLK